MKKVILFDNDYNYNDLANMGSHELYKVARREEMNDNAVRIMDLDEFQSYWNGTLDELCIKTNWLFFVDVEIFSVWVPDYNIEKFSDDYALYIEDSIVTHHDMHVCSLIAPKEVKEEVMRLREEGIFIV